MLQRYSGLCLAVMLANLKLMESLIAVDNNIICINKKVLRYTSLKKNNHQKIYVLTRELGASDVEGFREICKLG